MKNFKDLTDAVADCTNHNAHTLALTLIAEHYCMKLAKNKLRAIATLHYIYGSMPPELMKLRSDLWEEMKQSIKVTELELLNECL